MPNVPNIPDNPCLVYCCFVPAFVIGDLCTSGMNSPAGQSIKKCCGNCITGLMVPCLIIGDCCNNGMDSQLGRTMTKCCPSVIESRPIDGPNTSEMIDDM